MDKKEKKSLPEPRTYTVEQIAAMLNIGRTTAYQLVKQEEFRIVRIGSSLSSRIISGLKYRSTGSPQTLINWIITGRLGIAP